MLINGKSLGETGINAALAGYFKVPVILVTGDSVVAEEARSLLGTVETVAVKEGVGRFAARCLSPTKARLLIKEGATRAVKAINVFKPFRIEAPIRLEVAFVHTGMIEMAELLPGAKRINGRKVSFFSDDYGEVFKALRAMITLAGTNV